MSERVIMYSINSIDYVNITSFLNLDNTSLDNTYSETIKRILKLRLRFVVSIIIETGQTHEEEITYVAPAFHKRKAQKLVS